MTATTDDAPLQPTRRPKCAKTFICCCNVMMKQCTNNGLSRGLLKRVTLSNCTLYCADTRFTQQELPAYKPLLTPAVVKLLSSLMYNYVSSACQVQHMACATCKALLHLCAFASMCIGRQPVRHHRSCIPRIGLCVHQCFTAGEFSMTQHLSFRAAEENA